MQSLKDSTITLLPYLNCLIVIMVCHCFSRSVYAQSISLEPIATVNLPADAQWQSIASFPSREHSLLLASNQGQIFSILEHQKNASPLFDIREYLPNSLAVSLTAIAVSPNFNSSNEHGYHTIYTAHIEVSNKKSALQLSSLPHNRDAVIIAWQIKDISSQDIEIIKQQELMRIAISNRGQGVVRMRFNDYVDRWHKDHGLLFIAVSNTHRDKDDIKHLGAILRIRPEPFAFRQYQIPTDNPFIKQANIIDELVIQTANELVDFHWYNKEANKVLLHSNGDKQQVNIVAIGENLVDSPQSLPLWSNESRTINSAIMFYRGRKLMSLWKRVIAIQLIEQKWQISTLDNNKTAYKLFLDIPIDATKKSNTGLISHQQVNGDLLLLDTNSQQLLTINAASLSLNQIANEKQQPKTGEQSSQLFTIILIFLATITLIFTGYFLRKHLTKKQHFLEHEWANFTINEINQSISLYRRHQQEIAKELPLKLIQKSEVLLNDTPISCVSEQNSHCFSQEAANKFKQVFAQEKRAKMLDDKSRKIQLRLQDNQGEFYLLCLYYRLGNIRHTRAKYNQVLQKLAYWQWYYSQRVNNKTPEQPPLTFESEKPPEEKTFKLKNTNTYSIESSIPQSHCQTKINENNASEGSAEKLIKPDDLALNKSCEIATDYQLVNSLAKLTDLKQQGFLSEEEFSLAKSKILQDNSNTKT